MFSNFPYDSSREIYKCHVSTELSSLLLSSLRGSQREWILNALFHASSVIHVPPYNGSGNGFDLSWCSSDIPVPFALSF